ncbi:MAG: hypothetical protein WBO34_15320 [Gammaproteobacteria bacterium]
MTSTPNRLLILIAIFMSVFALQTAHAEQTQVSAPGQFTIQLPSVDREALIDQVAMLRSQLIEHKQALVQMVAAKKPDGRDAIITVIIPGGLLYAGYKKARYEQAKNDLADVSANIESLSADLLVMQSRAAPTVVAYIN